MEPFPESTSTDQEGRPVWPSPGLVLIHLLGTALFGVLIGTMLAQALSNAYGVELQALLNSLNLESPASDRNFARWINGIAHICTFGIPAIVTALFFARSQWVHFLKLDQLPGANNLGLGFLLVFASFPVVQALYWLNKEVLPLPAGWRAMDSSTQDMVEALLVMDSPAELALSLFIIAILPALGEEFIFRGVVQPQLQRWTGKPILAIWLSAFIFSLVHFQFEGFLPRFFLGAVLGYLFHWTRSLWTPIAAHFLFNGLQVVAQYYFAEQVAKGGLESAAPNIWLTLSSIAIILGLSNYLKKTNLQPQS